VCAASSVTVKVADNSAGGTGTGQSPTM
jgi:hypothetical protein